MPKFFSNKPIIKNAYCPQCGNQVMEERLFLNPVAEDEILYTCLHCYASFNKDDESFQNANRSWTDSITNLEVQETNSGVKSHITNDNIPLKRKNIRVRDIEMHSECPACGGILYEEANVIFNYCPWCAQALNNNDFSEDEKVEN